LLHTVFEWKRLPSEFGLCKPDEDLVMMMAYSSAIEEMKSYEAMVAEEEAELRNARGA